MDANRECIINRRRGGDRADDGVATADAGRRGTTRDDERGARRRDRDDGDATTGGFIDDAR